MIRSHAAESGRFLGRNQLLAAARLNSVLFRVGLKSVRVFAQRAQLTLDLAELMRATRSYFEVTLFCLVTHLEFRSVVPTAGYAQLGEFCRDFGERRSALDTGYRFDT